jgi:dolichol-phosphate mannosyltransferase
MVANSPYNTWQSRSAKRPLDSRQTNVMRLPYSEPCDQRKPLMLAVVIPTFNERANIDLLLERLRKTLQGIEWEAIFVDDNSPDGTATYLRHIARRDAHVRVLQRIGRRGLASACIEGMLATAAPYIAVMDADLQHDESILPGMYQRVSTNGLDLVVGSRNIAGGSMGEFAKERVALSGLGARLSGTVLKCGLSDPMSGFFVVSRAFFEEVAGRLSGVGFKVLVDLVASAERPVRFAEVPYTFRTRKNGESKLDINVALEYLLLLLDKVIGNWVPSRFVLFVAVGGLGLLVHLAVLAVLYMGAGESFLYAQAAATLVAMTFNFLLNNVTTFRDRRLRGFGLAIGLATFYAACSVGAMTNLVFAKFLLQAGLPWYAAGVVCMAVSSVWNYGVNAILTWRQNIRANQTYRLNERLIQSSATEGPSPIAS